MHLGVPDDIGEAAVGDSFQLVRDGQLQGAAAYCNLGAGGMEHGEWGMGHGAGGMEQEAESRRQGAESMEHGAWSMEHVLCLPAL